MGELTIFRCDPWAAYLAEQVELCRAEGEARDLELDMADRLGLPSSERADELELRAESRRCERCLELWPFGLELVGGEALCQPCIDTELEEAG